MDGATCFFLILTLVGKDEILCKKTFRRQKLTTSVYQNYLHFFMEDVSLSHISVVNDRHEEYTEWITVF